MSGQKKKGIITFDEFHHCMMLDPYYGVESIATNSIIASLYRKHVDSVMYRQFEKKFSLLPCKDDRQRHLIYLWCGLMELSVYREGDAIDWQWQDFLENWTQDFDIQRVELKHFLRQHLLPLPVALFGEETDNTKRKITLDEEEYSRAFDDFTIKIPQLEADLEELKKIQPESMEARQQKKIEIENIERQIENIYSGNHKDDNETPTQRRQRLKKWYQEEIRLRGRQGSLNRTAKREGITRQTLSIILKRSE